VLVQKLICELCRSNDFTKDDQGFFVCDYCRTKYTTAQAQSMMVEGTVRVDRTGEETSLITLASSALASGNYQEALEYANKALEIDPQNSIAWYTKGTSAGWLSTPQAHRLRETQNAFELAIQNASEGERSEVQKWCALRTKELAEALAQPSWSPGRSGAVRVQATDKLAEQHEVQSRVLLDVLALSYQWYERPAPLAIYISIASDLMRGVPYHSVLGKSAQTRIRALSKDQRADLRVRIDWAESQIKRFDPSYSTRGPKEPKVWQRWLTNARQRL
jgi:hypothetical protein